MSVYLKKDVAYAQDDVPSKYPFAILLHLIILWSARCQLIEVTREIIEIFKKLNSFNSSFYGMVTFSRTLSKKRDKVIDFIWNEIDSVSSGWYLIKNRILLHELLDFCNILQCFATILITKNFRALFYSLLLLLFFSTAFVIEYNRYYLICMQIILQKERFFQLQSHTNKGFNKNEKPKKQSKKIQFSEKNIEIFYRGEIIDSWNFWLYNFWFLSHFTIV